MEHAHLLVVVCPTPEASCAILIFRRYSMLQAQSPPFAAALERFQVY